MNKQIKMEYSIHDKLYGLMRKIISITNVTCIFITNNEFIKI